MSEWERFETKKLMRDMLNFINSYLKINEDENGRLNGWAVETQIATLKSVLEFLGEKIFELEERLDRLTEAS